MAKVPLTKRTSASSSPNDEIWIVICAYNEKSALPAVLDELSCYPYHIVVVDDGSSDGSVELAKEYNLVWLRHICNLGQGAALETGFTYIREKTMAEYAVTFDGDGQHAVADIQKLIDALIASKSEVALGSRFLQGGTASNIPWNKKLLLKLAIWFTRISTGLHLTDTHNGLRAFTRGALMKIRISQNGMAHASEILSLIKQHALPYCEVPVSIKYSEYAMKKGQKLSNSINILWEFFFGGH